MESRKRKLSVGEANAMCKVNKDEQPVTSNAARFDGMAILFNFCEESGVDGFFQADVSQLPLPPAVMSKLFSDDDLTREDRLQKHHLDSYGGIPNFQFSLFAKVETGTSDRGEDTWKLRDAYQYKRDHNLGVEGAYATLVREYPGVVHKNYELQTESNLARCGEMRRRDRRGAQDGWLV